MKLQGKCIVGDPISVESYTSDWMSVRVHPTTFYRRQEEIHDGFKNTKGLYAEIDLGQYIIIRFAEKDDMTAFHRLHHEYL